jgi:hypothetical protein
MTTKRVSEETREWMAESVWFRVTYPEIKARAERIQKTIEDLENKFRNRKQKKD